MNVLKQCHQHIQWDEDSMQMTPWQVTSNQIHWTYKHMCWTI